MTWDPVKYDERDQTKWGWMVQHREKFVVGSNVDIGAFTYINAAEGVIIGKDVQIGSHCSIYSVNSEDRTRGKVIIGEGARIGAHSVIMPGVIIGKGAVVGACSFVKRDVPAGTRVAGVPAKPMRAQTMTAAEYLARPSHHDP